MAEIDAELATAIKAAKTGKNMYFAMIAKGATDGQLLVSKTKIPPAKINEAKKEAGGGTVIRGRCIGEDGIIVFQTAKEPAGTAETLAKKLIKTNAGLVLNVVFRVSADAEDEAEESAGEESAAKSSEPKKFSTVAYTKSRLSWDGAKNRVHGDLAKLVKAILDEFPDDNDMTVKMVEHVDGVLGQFDEQLKDVLDDALSATDDTVRQQHHAKAVKLIEKYRGFIKSESLVKQIKSNPFVPVDIEAALDSSLNEIHSHLSP